MFAFLFENLFIGYTDPVDYKKSEINYITYHPQHANLQTRS